MDEEELEQSNKRITIDNFFESISSIDEVANRALQQSQENFNLVSVNSNLLQGLEQSIQLIESDIQQITNYFIVQQDQRRKQLEIREQELSKRQDISQKRIGDKLQDATPFESRPRNFGEALRQGAVNLAQDITRPFIGPGVVLGLSGLLGIKDGGEPPINQPAIVCEEGPEIFIPKTPGTIIPNDKKINVRALLNTISVAEGTAKGGYGTIYGGTDDNPITVPELASGEMTIGQVLNMMKTGEIERTRMIENDKGEMVEEKYMSDVGYGKENNVGATGRYQFIPAALEEEVRHMMKKDKNFSYDTLFTPDVQNKLILQRLKEKRNIDFDKLEKEGLTRGAIDKLSEEFESFPNLLPGPRKDDLGPVEGSPDQSFYDIKGDQAPV